VRDARNTLFKLQLKIYVDIDWVERFGIGGWFTFRELCC